MFLVHVYKGLILSIVLSFFKISQHSDGGFCLLADVLMCNVFHFLYLVIKYIPATLSSRHNASVHDNEEDYTKPVDSRQIRQCTYRLHHPPSLEREFSEEYPYGLPS